MTSVSELQGDPPTPPTTITACPASCGRHGTLYAPCTVPGGCGSEGCTDGRERRCAAGSRCAESDRAKELTALLAYGSPPLCPDCLRVAERDVRWLPSDYAALEQWLPKPLSEWSDGQPKRGRGEHPLPLREFVLVVQRHIWWVATRVGAGGAGDRPAVGRGDLKPGRTLTVCQLQVFGVEGRQRSLVATGQQTLIRLNGRPDQ